MYTEKTQAKLQVGAGAVDDLSATGVHTYSFVFLSQVGLRRLMALITTAVVSSAPAIVSFKKRPAYGSASGEVIIGTLSIPGGALKDTVYYKDIDEVTFKPGDQLVFDVTTAASASGGTAYDVEAYDDPEYAPDQSKMVASV